MNITQIHEYIKIVYINIQRIKIYITLYIWYDMKKIRIIRPNRKLKELVGNTPFILLTLLESEKMLGF